MQIHWKIMLQGKIKLGLKQEFLGVQIQPGITVKTTLPNTCKAGKGTELFKKLQIKICTFSKPGMITRHDGAAQFQSKPDVFDTVLSTAGNRYRRKP